MKKSTFDALKRFPITEFLALCNCLPAKKAGPEWLYLSPIRSAPERTPSFSVNTVKNCWKDFGSGDGGNLLDLGQHLFKTDYLTAAGMVQQIVANAHRLPPLDERPARHRADAPTGSDGDEVSQCIAHWATANQVGTAEPVSKVTVLRVGTLRNAILCEYLVSRGISLAAVQADPAVWGRLREVEYQQNGRGWGRANRPYFAIGMGNESGGVELLARGFKSCLGHKNATFIPGKQSGVLIFEGLMDFLSAMTMTHKHLKGKWRGFPQSVLVLNSAGNRRKSLHLVKNAGSIFYYGDNDQEGIDTAAFYRKECRGQDFYNSNENYRGYKDLNDWLMKKKPAANKPLHARGQAPSHKAVTANWWLWAVFRGAAQRSARSRDHQRTFYAYTNTPEAHAKLLALRNRLTDDTLVIRLCTRTSGRNFTYEQLHCPTGRVTTDQSPQRGPWSALPAGNPGSWGRPGNAPPAPPERPAGA